MVLFKDFIYKARKEGKNRKPIISRFRNELNADNTDINTKKMCLIIIIILSSHRARV